MFDVRNFYKSENDKITDNYEKDIDRIREIIKETEGKDDAYTKFFNETSKFIIKLYELEKKLNEEYFKTKRFNELLKENRELYKHMDKKAYETSYANPSYCVTVFGNRLGQLMSFFYSYFLNNIENVFFHTIFIIKEKNELFIKVYEYIKNNDKPDYQDLKKLITDFSRRDKKLILNYKYKEKYDKNFRFYTDFIEKSDLSDLRYLFKVGKYVTDNEMNMATFLYEYPDEKLRKIAEGMYKAYIRGFEKEGKSIEGKKTYILTAYLGEEKLTKHILEVFREHGLEGTFARYYTTDTNKQYAYDHRFDSALYFDEDYVNTNLSNTEQAMEANKDILSENSGGVYMDNFGEPPFNPLNKIECLKYSPEQQKLSGLSRNKLFSISNKYIPLAETSFTIISFPTPEIGDKFEKIFDEVYKINTLDSDKYEKIQQYLIDVLDKADYVHVKGKGTNQTDVKVKMQEIKNSDKESLFVNCGADLNIPVGEVYTSPQLKGTTGILHIKETFLNSLNYKDLWIKFKDGFVEEYSCKNFEDEEENKKYFQENLLFPHDTLPLGEFAIGTNTYAYKVSREYNIMDILPILIIEKVGPHFAIGDTCFSRSEDIKIFNQFNQKQIIAKDNEKSILRKTDMDKAYTNRHTDITLPYDEIEFITAVTKNGDRTDLIRDGRFVLEGTEELNKPLDEM